MVGLGMEVGKEKGTNEILNLKKFGQIWCIFCHHWVCVSKVGGGGGGGRKTRETRKKREREKILNKKSVCHVN